MPCVLRSSSDVIHQGPDNPDFDQPAKKPVALGKFLLACKVIVNVQQRMGLWISDREAGKHMRRAQISLKSELAQVVKTRNIGQIAKAERRLCHPQIRLVETELVRSRIGHRETMTQSLSVECTFWVHTSHA